MLISWVKLATIRTYSEAIERKEGLECTRSARLGPSGVGRPRVVGQREGEGGPGSSTRARIEGRGEAKHVGPTGPEP